MPPTVIVTTSWDDGDIADLRLSEILSSAGIRGTFYVPLAFKGRPIAIDVTRSIASQGFEIGGHGVTHRTLSSLVPAEVRSEVRESRSMLEQVIGNPVQTFCYPNGRFTPVAMRELRDAGYIGARTTRMLGFSMSDPYKIPVTVQAYPHPVHRYLRNLCKGRNLTGLGYYARFAPRAPTWVELSKAMFDFALAKGGIWHMYGHSWEIEQLNLWGQLKEVLDYIGSRPNVRYATNSETICEWKAEQGKR